MLLAGRGGGGAGRGLPHSLAGRGGLLLELLLLLEPALLLKLLGRLSEALLRLLLESSLLGLLKTSLLGLCEPLLLPLLLLHEESLYLGLSEPLRPQTVHELLRALLLSTLLAGH